MYSQSKGTFHTFCVNLNYILAFWVITDLSSKIRERMKLYFFFTFPEALLGLGLLSI